MTKPLRILDDVAERDLPGIIAYHRPRSRAKAAAILAEYDRVVDLLRGNPLIFRVRPHGWRVCIFRSGVYALYYRETEDAWLVAGIFHAGRDPDWTQAQLIIRDARETAR
jgi:plasmid stabilization system protein ParE